MKSMYRIVCYKFLICCNRFFENQKKSVNIMFKYLCAIDDDDDGFRRFLRFACIQNSIKLSLIFNLFLFLFKPFMMKISSFSIVIVLFFSRGVVVCLKLISKDQQTENVFLLEMPATILILLRYNIAWANTNINFLLSRKSQIWIYGPFKQFN